MAHLIIETLLPQTHMIATAPTIVVRLTERMRDPQRPWKVEEMVRLRAMWTWTPKVGWSRSVHRGR